MPVDRLVDLAGVRLHLRTWQGPGGSVPVVLLPATGETADDWDHVGSVLSATRTVHAVDLRGHGGSDWPGEYSVDTMAEDVVALLTRLATDGPVDLVGHSLGGLVASRAAAAATGLVRRLVLEDVGMLHPRAAAAPDRPPGHLLFDWRVVEQVRPEIDQPSPDWPDVLRAVSAPTLVVSGGSGSPVTPAQVDELLALVADSRSVTVEAGHHVHAQEPDAFVEQVSRFLDA